MPPRERVGYTTNLHSTYSYRTPLLSHRPMRVIFSTCSRMGVSTQATLRKLPSWFMSRFRQRPQQRNQDQLAYAAAVAEAERLNANRKRQRNIAELRGATDAASADLMAQILKTSTDQLEIQRRTNIVLQDLSTALAALTSNQTDLHRSMALQEERIRQLGTMTSTLVTQVQGIQGHLNSTLSLPPSYGDVVDIEGEVQR